ncbi:hypothetical protein ACFQS2_13365 [Brachybacterium sp. GCM10030267]|uniref:hypothetical protein n=1 Tax=unclassified Brachybacterium TaxID=2623841 RepID=UPI00360DD822
MIQRGSDKNGPNLDDELKHETSGMVDGTQPDHVEEFRQTEPMPDDTDADEVEDAAGMTGNEVDAELVWEEDSENPGASDA